MRRVDEYLDAADTTGEVSVGGFEDAWIASDDVDWFAWISKADRARH